jgi:hypothetical protein
VLGASGNGGDITIRAGALVLNNGFIQANTAATGAGGGDVNISANALLSSGNNLTIGGSEPAVFRPGLNVIQAAAPAGVSGSIHTTLPSLDIAGKLVALNAEVIDLGRLAKDPCRVGTKSSFTPVARGGLRPTATGLIRPERVDMPSHEATARDTQMQAGQQVAQLEQPSECR